MSDRTRYPVPRESCCTEEVIQQSRFITTVAHAASEAEARSFISGVRNQSVGAAHTCWAYVVGPPGNTMTVGMSDDGEPKGTAGKPMLQVLMNSGVGDIAAVVTRYWGGVKLGKGGLVRAYSSGVQQALRTLKLTEFVRRESLTLEIDYATVAPFRRMLPDYEIEVDRETFGEKVTYSLKLPDNFVDAFVNAIVDLTSGRALVRRASGSQRLENGTRSS